MHMVTELSYIIRPDSIFGEFPTIGLVLPVVAAIWEPFSADLFTSEQLNYRKNPGSGYTSFNVNLKAVDKYPYSTDKMNTNFQIFPIPHHAQALTVSMPNI